MESLLIKIGVILKWLFPAAVGSGMAIFIAKEPNTDKRKFLLFIFGIAISGILGGGLVEYFSIHMTMVQAAIYFGVGVWGIGIITQINDQLPQLIRAFFSKIFGVTVDKDAE